MIDTTEPSIRDVRKSLFERESVSSAEISSITSSAAALSSSIEP